MDMDFDIPYGNNLVKYYPKEESLSTFWVRA
jgi:hypothetical protein